MVIRKEELSHFQRWHVGSFDSKRPAETPSPAVESRPETTPPEEATPQFNLPTAEDIEQIHEEARNSGYQAGFAEGLAAGEKQARDMTEAQAEKFLALIGNLKKSVAELEQTVAEQLLALATEIASQVIRSTISVRPETLVPVIREAISALPLHHAHIVVRLNPGDIEHVRAEIGEQFSQIGAQLVEDHAVTLGGCMLHAGSSEIDATIETRWKRVLEAIGTEPQEWLKS